VRITIGRIAPETPQRKGAEGGIPTVPSWYPGVSWASKGGVHAVHLSQCSTGVARNSSIGVHAACLTTPSPRLTLRAVDHPWPDVAAGCLSDQSSSVDRPAVTFPATPSLTQGVGNNPRDNVVVCWREADATVFCCHRVVRQPIHRCGPLGIEPRCPDVLS